MSDCFRMHFAVVCHGNHLKLLEIKLSKECTPCFKPNTTNRIDKFIPNILVDYPNTIAFVLAFVLKDGIHVTS